MWVDSTLMLEERSMLLGRPPVDVAKQTIDVGNAHS